MHTLGLYALSQNGGRGLVHSRCPANYRDLDEKHTDCSRHLKNTSQECMNALMAKGKHKGLQDGTVEEAGAL